MMLLDKINSPRDLKALSLQQLTLLAQEVRERIIEVVSVTGGHLASSLGAVELAIALHYCLDTPQDKIVWDVGHQSYAHKILTSRNKDFKSLRQYSGLSGFPCKDESEYDVFTTGHSSTAISLALGLACSRDNLAEEEYFKVVAVVGDGSLSGGLSFEGLNNAGHFKKDILVILNTNELSIAPNVGALSTYLNKIISLPIYNRFKDSLEGFAKSRLPKGGRILKIANKFEEGLKGLFIPGMFFEELGFRYFGPLDGHNLHTLIPALKNILNIKGPRLLHIITKKGKGYPPAEKEPVRFHGTGPFEVKSGRPIIKEASSALTYTEVFSRKLLELAKANKKIVAITAAMPEGTGLDKFRDLYPQRFFDVGIAEAHAVCFASGLAHQGLRPVVCIYSTFLQRAYDQIIEDVCLQKTPVIFCLDRAGIVGEDGATHQGIFDIAFLRSVPNLVVMAPKDALELEMMLEFAINSDRPVAIRYPRSVCPLSSLPVCPLELGKAEVLKEGKDLALIALGSMVAPAYQAVEILEKEGLSPSLVNARFVKPLDMDLLKKISSSAKFIFTLEEGILEGGFGSAVAEAIDKPEGSGLPSDKPEGSGLASFGQSHKPVIRIGLPCEFIPHGKREIFLEKYGLTPEAIAKKIRAYA